MDLGLTGRKVIINGGAHGLGLAALKILAAEGADVVLDAVFQSDRVTVPGAAGRPAPDYVWANDDDQ
eukprot:gene31152-40105_t